MIGRGGREKLDEKLNGAAMAVFYSFRDGKVKRIAATRKPKKG